jgi:hypothetical protein
MPSRVPSSSPVANITTAIINGPPIVCTTNPLRIVLKHCGTALFRFTTILDAGVPKRNAWSILVRKRIPPTAFAHLQDAIGTHLARMYPPVAAIIVAAVILTDMRGART